jgi:hypothetical protein
MPSAIVARDASGNFSAGAITASLIGTASGNSTASSTETLINKSIDTAAAGNNITIPVEKEYAVAVMQGAAPSTGFQLPSTLAPAPTVEDGTNTNRASLDFPDADGDYEIQGNFRLPAGTTAVALDGWWKTAATTGDVAWQIQAACVADGEDPDAAFNAPQAIVDAAAGIANRHNAFSLSSLTFAGCSGGEQFFWRMFRNRTHASDTIASASIRLAGTLTFTMTVTR